MTDKKLSDNEIIKALKCCGHGRYKTNKNFCNDCPMGCKANCGFDLLKNALDLINRQKAENERLQKAIAVIDIMEDQHKYDLKKAKADAIKEFAERLKESEGKITTMFLCRENITTYVPLENIDNLVKEMVGDNDE